LKARASHVATSLHRRPPNVDVLATSIEKEHGWAPANKIAERAMRMFESPKKRGQAPDILTTDQVNK